MLRRDNCPIPDLPPAPSLILTNKKPVVVVSTTFAGLFVNRLGKASRFRVYMGGLAGAVATGAAGAAIFLSASSRAACMALTASVTVIFCPFLNTSVTSSPCRVVITSDTEIPFFGDFPGLVSFREAEAFVSLDVVDEFTVNDNRLLRVKRLAADFKVIQFTDDRD